MKNVFMVVSIVLAAGAGFSQDEDPRVRVPGVIGDWEEDAIKKIQNAGLTTYNFGMHTTQYEYSDEIEEGIVMNQQPAAGSLAWPGSQVQLYVSAGPLATVPSFLGLQFEEAQERAAQTNTTVSRYDPYSSGVVTECVDDESIMAGACIRQKIAAGERVPPGTYVDLVFSSGPCSATVPNVLGDDTSAAFVAIQEAGLVPKLRFECEEGLTGWIHDAIIGEAYNNCAGSVDSVCWQNPPGGNRVVWGTKVDIVANSGTCTWVVPDVVGHSWQSAVRILTEEGFQWDWNFKRSDEGMPYDTVIAQSPPGGTRANPGITVDITIVEGLYTLIMPDVIGMDEMEAVLEIFKSGFSLIGIGTEECGEPEEVGKIVKQYPPAGTVTTDPNCPRLTEIGATSYVPELRGEEFWRGGVILLEHGMFESSEIAGYDCYHWYEPIPYGFIARTDPPAGTAICSAQDRVSIIRSNGLPCSIFEFEGEGEPSEGEPSEGEGEYPEGEIPEGEGEFIEGEGELQEGEGEDSGDSGQGDEIQYDCVEYPNPEWYLTEGVPATIENNSSHSSAIGVLEDGNITDIRVRVTLNYFDAHSLMLGLVSPSGTSVMLYNGKELKGVEFQYLEFNDNASKPITPGAALYYDSFQPQEPLSAFHGEKASGFWRLLVFGKAFTGFSGTLQDWNLCITTDSPGALQEEIDYGEPLEMRLARELRDRFDEFDANADGTLDEDELSIAWAMLPELFYRVDSKTYLEIVNEISGDETTLSRNMLESYISGETPEEGEEPLDISPEGEGESEGESEGEPEGETQDEEQDRCGCNGGKNPVEAVKFLVDKWLILGASIAILLLLSRYRHR